MSPRANQKSLFSMICVAAATMLLLAAPVLATDAELKKASPSEKEAPSGAAQGKAADAEKKDKDEADTTATGEATQVTPAVGTVEDIYVLRVLDLDRLRKERVSSKESGQTVIWREVDE